MKYVISFFTSLAMCLVSFQWVGGSNPMLRLLVGAMIMDYLSGLALSLVFKKSTKTESGTYNSKAGIIGIMKKGAILAIVWIAYMLQSATGFEGLRDIVIVAFSINEVISIIENMGNMGVYIPAPLMKAIEVLQADVGNYGKEENKDDKPGIKRQD